MLKDMPQKKSIGRRMKTLLPKVTQMQEALKQLSPQQIAHNSGAALDRDILHLKMLFQPFTLDVATFVACDSTGKPASLFTQSLILTYLHTADGTPFADQWISFRELPNGSFYHQAFQGYAANRLSQQWRLNIDVFSAACFSAGGTPIDLGDAAFSFVVLPRVKLAAVYWLGDEDFPSQASILFDAVTPHYMITDGLAILGNQLVGKILAV